MQVKDFVDMCDAFERLLKRCRELAERPENLYALDEAYVTIKTEDDKVLINLMIMLFNFKAFR